MGILLEKMEKICRTLSFQFMSIRITIFMLGDVWNNEDISMSDIIREVCIFKPNCLQDELEIADTLLSGRTVILNLERFNFTASQRILDFTAGVCWAEDGSMIKISDYLFAIGPHGVNITGDIAGIPEMASKADKKGLKSNVYDFVSEGNDKRENRSSP